MIMKRSYYAIESKTIGHIKLLMNYHILITQYSLFLLSFYHHTKLIKYTYVCFKLSLSITLMPEMKI